MTYKAKVEEFWKWFEENSERFLKTIDTGNCGDLQPETTEAVHKLGLGAWVYGPPPEGESGHSLTITGEGLIHKQFLTEYWKLKAPQLSGWTFFSSRQAGDIEGRIEINDLQIEFQAIWISATVDDENEKIDIQVWHHDFPNIEENAKFTIIFIVLDELIGEYGTDNWIGEIQFLDAVQESSFPIAELKEYVQNIETQSGWKKYAPTEVYSTFQIEEIDRDFPRSDIAFGTTANYKIVTEFLNAKGVMDSPIEGTGADFIYISMNNELLPRGQEVDFRCDIEDALSEALEAESSGKVFGGATGRVNFYIDVLIYDGEKSIETIKSVLRSRNLPDDTFIRYFEKNREIHELNSEQGKNKSSFFNKLFKK